MTGRKATRTIIRFDAYVTWTDRDGHEFASRPQRREHLHEARNAGTDVADLARRCGGTNIDARVFQVEFEETFDRHDEGTWRELSRQLVLVMGEIGSWQRSDAVERAPRHVMETWLNVLRDTNTSGPATPPDDVKRAGPQAISDWYRARMDRSEAEAVARHQAVMKELRGEL